MPPKDKRYRIQGTDGIRREIMPADAEELEGLSPQQVFLERGFITEELMELYTYAHVKNLLEKGDAEPGSDFVIGWDPRDVAGDFNQAAVQGIRKAGCRALVLGIVSTPLSQMFIAHKKAAGGFMITASHNPSDQNGIKTFMAYRGMKLLPENDIALTRSILSLNYDDIARKPLVGKKVNCRDQALKLFARFSLHPDNSWSKNVSYGNIILVVDPANGSLTEIAAKIFRKAGFGKVIEVNGKLNGDVNLKSGVGDLEGRSIIPAAMITRGSGLFSRHAAIVKLFQLGRKHKPQIQAGRLRVCGAAFDADGDRFYRLDYHPGKDALLVMSGDQTAWFQTEYLLARDPKRYQGAYCINTVESDLNAGQALEKLGLKLQLSAVGDKWVLYRIACLLTESRIGHLLKILKRRRNDPSAKRTLKKASALKMKLRACKNSSVFDVNRMRDIDSSINSLLLESEIEYTRDERTPIVLGSEETGHCVTQGRLEGNPPTAVFFGNGLKSALNTFSATQFLLKDTSVREYFARLERPFKPGFKETYYVYYINKELFRKNSPVWRRIKKCVMAEGKLAGFHCSTLNIQEDADTLYLALNQGGPVRSQRRPRKSGAPENGIFIRNSGTENKISVNLRGSNKNARALKAIGEICIRFLISALKDKASRHYKLELSILRRVAEAPLPESAIRDPSEKRVTMEMLKQGLIKPGAKGYRLTERGKWYTTRDL